MEQATTGKAPPPIINSGGGGGVQVLNMNAVRGGPAGIGANVVPSPGSAQTATLVGSPGPPGKGGVGPRMISISPQMLANASRPGQHVEESDSESVNHCDESDDNHELNATNAEPKPRLSPSSSASITGVSSSDLQQHACDDNFTVVDSKCEEGELSKDDNSIIVKVDSKSNDVVKTSDNHFEGSDRKNTDDDNDLTPSSLAVDKESVSELGSPSQNIVSERSAPQSPKYSHPLSSSPHTHSPRSPTTQSTNPPPSDGGDSSPYNSKLENELRSCDENKNQEDGVCINVEYNSNSNSCLFPASSRDADDIIQQDRQGNGTSSNSNGSNNDLIVNSGSNEVVSKGSRENEEDVNYVGSIGSEENNDKCIYDNVNNDVPVPRDVVYTSQIDDEESPKSDLGALQHSSNNNIKNNINVDNLTSQSCVQTSYEKSSVSAEESCDKFGAEEKKTFATVVEDKDKLPLENKCLGEKNSSKIIEEEPPPLVHDVRPEDCDDMGNTESKEPEREDMDKNESKQQPESQGEGGEEEDAVNDEQLADEADVNLDLFSDSVGLSESGDGIMPIGSLNGTNVQQVERSNFSDDSRLSPSSKMHNPEDKILGLEATTTTDLSQENEMTENDREDENRPKLMDMNLADLIYMDCDDDIVVLGEVPSPIQQAVTVNKDVNFQSAWNQQSERPSVPVTTTSHSTNHTDHPFSPPKSINEIFPSSMSPPASSRISSAITTGPSTTNPFFESSNNPASFWNKNKTVASPPESRQVQQQPSQPSPPSCAFQIQMYGNHGQQHENLQVAARIPIRNELHNPQQHLNYSSSSSGTRQSQPSGYSNFNSSIIRDGATGLAPAPNNSNQIVYSSPTRANVNNVSPEYKTNHSHHILHQQQQQLQQQQRCFTTDPQLHSQFLQFTKNYPLGQQQENNQESCNKMSSSLPISSTVARGQQYGHAPTHHPQQQQQQDHVVHPSKSHPIKPAVIFPHQQPHHQQINPSLRQPTGVVQQTPHQQRQYTPLVPRQQHYPHQQNPQQTSQLQSQYRSNIINANGCDNLNKSGYHVPHLNNSSPAVNFQVNSNYNGGHGHVHSIQPPTSVVQSSSARQAMEQGGSARPFYPQHSSHQNPPSSSLAQSHLQIRQVHQEHPAVMQKEPSSCSYNIAGGTAIRVPVNPAGGMPNSSQLTYTNLSGPSNTSVAHQHSYKHGGNFVGYNNTSASSGPNARMPYAQHQQQQPYHPTAVRSMPNMPSSASQISANNSNKPVGHPPSSTIPTVPSGWNPPLLQGARAQLLQVLRPGALPNHQNLGGRGGDMIHQRATAQQTVNRLPFPGVSTQQHYRIPSHPQQIQQGPIPTHQQAQQRSASVIAPRYSGGGTNTGHHGMPGGSSSSDQQKQPPTSSSTMPSPQMLRNSQYLAHTFRPMSTSNASSELRPITSSTAAYNQSSVIRPNLHNSASTITGNTAITTNVNSNTSSSINNLARPFYGNSSTSSSNTYYNNQASVIKAPSSSINSSSSTGSNTNACTINRNSTNSCIVIERSGTNSSTGHHNSTTSTSTGGGYNGGGELTLQSFLSNPSAPFNCPSTSPTPNSSSPLPAERTTSVGSGYQYNNTSSENWGVGASYNARGDNQDETYPSLSSCQYSADGAMRRFNAPITLQSLQALSGLPPGANHLLVKTENGQFQLVSVRMQSPTAAAAAPGTPVVPSTVAAPPTSMSIAQQLPSNSPLVAPPLPPSPHGGPLTPGGTPSSLIPPLPPPISSSMITTTTIPPHLTSAQQGRIITSSSSNHIVTSWSSSNNNSLVNNNSTSSSPHPVMSSSAAHPPPPHSPHLAPPPPSAPPHHHTPSLPVPPLPPSVPSSVIMPPSLSSASNSQLLTSTANNNISSSSSATYSNAAAQAAISAVLENYNQQRAASSAQQQQQHGSVMGPPGGSRQQPPPPPSNSIPAVVAPATGPMSNSIPPGASVIRSGVGMLGASSLPPPPPPVVVNTNSSSAAVAAVANSVISSSTNPSNSNLPPAAAPPTSPAAFRPQQQSNTASPVPNNNATNNASGSMGIGMMTASSNSIMSVQHPNHHHHHHQTPPPYNSQLHPHPQPPQQAPSSAYHTSYTSNSIASSNSTNTTANTVSQMSNETAKTKCKNFLSFLLELSAKQNQTVARNVKNLIQGLIDGKVNEENFADRLQKEVNSQPQPCLVGFLKKSLPHLRHSLAVSELKIEGIKPPPLAALVPPAPVSALIPQTPPTPPEPTRKKPSKQTPAVRPTTPTVPASPVRIIAPPVNSASPSSTPPAPAVSASSSGTPTPPTASPSPSSTKSSKPSKGSSAKSKSNSSSNSSSAGGSSASSGPGGTPSSKSSIPSTSKSSKEKEKKDKTFSSSGYSGDDDINDVAAMGGVNLAEESQRILGSTEYVGTQIRSCRDETLIQASPISAKFKVIAAKYGLEETPSAEVSALLSHAVEERLKTMIEKLSVIAEHRMDVIKLDDRYEITQDVKGQLRFLEELDKLEKKRHDEQEREMLIRAAKSRSKSEDPEQAKLKAKAKEMQRVALEEMRQRDANLTALQAIGPRKKPKLDIPGGSHGSAVPSPMGATGASSSLGRPQMPLRPRLKRVNLRDLLFLLEHDKETMRSPFLYKNLLLK